MHSLIDLWYLFIPSVVSGCRPSVDQDDTSDDQYPLCFQINMACSCESFPSMILLYSLSSKLISTEDFQCGFLFLGISWHKPIVKIEYFSLRKFKKSIIFSAKLCGVILLSRSLMPKSNMRMWGCWLSRIYRYFFKILSIVSPPFPNIDMSVSFSTFRHSLYGCHNVDSNLSIKLCPKHKVLGLILLEAIMYIKRVQVYLKIRKNSDKLPVKTKKLFSFDRISCVMILDGWYWSCDQGHSFFSQATQKNFMFHIKSVFVLSRHSKENITTQRFFFWHWGHSFNDIYFCYNRHFCFNCCGVTIKAPKDDAQQHHHPTT